MWAEVAYNETLSSLKRGSRLLDIGCGDGEHAKGFRKVFDVTTLDLKPEADIIGDYLSVEIPKMDCIWASHVLEHQRNPGLFLDKVFKDLRPGGLLAITVPPRKDEIVGGHVTLWNAGLLLYNLVLAGFDCSRASLYVQEYDISVLVKKKEASLPTLKRDSGDIEKLANFFPFEVHHGFDGKCAA